MNFVKPNFGYIDVEAPAYPVSGGHPGLPAEVKAALLPVAPAIQPAPAASSVAPPTAPPTPTPSPTPTGSPSSGITLITAPASTPKPSP
jgi:hypothetical protein